MFTFLEETPDDALMEISRELPTRVHVAQYLIKCDTPLCQYEFQNEEKYSVFFSDFARYASSGWKDKTSVDWDFSKFPFREPVDTLRGVHRVLKTGGAYTQGIGEEEASRSEERLRRGLQKDSASLLIFCASNEDFRGEDVSNAFGVPEDLFELDKVSPWFEGIAWDGLMFILDPQHSVLNVIAYTDTD
jgi:hypothetical protein